MASSRYTIRKGGQRKVQSYFDQSCGSIRPQLYSFGTRFYPAPCFGHIPARCTLFWPLPLNKQHTACASCSLDHNHSVMCLIAVPAVPYPLSLANSTNTNPNNNSNTRNKAAAKPTTLQEKRRLLPGCTTVRVPAITRDVHQDHSIYDS